MIGREGGGQNWCALKSAGGELYIEYHAAISQKKIPPDFSIEVTRVHKNKRSRKTWGDSVETEVSGCVSVFCVHGTKLGINLCNPERCAKKKHLNLGPVPIRTWDTTGRTRTGYNTVGFREIETTVFDPASVFLSTH